MATKTILLLTIKLGLSLGWPKPLCITISERWGGGGNSVKLYRNMQPHRVQFLSPFWSKILNQVG